MAPPLAAATRGVPTTLAAGEAVRILYADDHDTNLRMMERSLLKGVGAEVTKVTDGDQVLDAVQAAARAGKPFHIIMLDINMKRMNGDAALRQLRGHGITTPVMAVTGGDDASPGGPIDDIGFDHVYSKPFQMSLARPMVDRWTVRTPAAGGGGGGAGTGGGAGSALMLR